MITAQKEYLRNSKPNTINIIDRIVSENKFPKLRLNRIHYPGTNGFKTDQLQFAFKQILKNTGTKLISESFFLLLDADSEPDINTIRRFNDSIESGFEIYQQPLLRFKNLNEIKSPLMQSFAFLQAFFCISYEIPMFIERFFPWRLKFLIADGLLLKGSFLIYIGGFSKIMDDIRLGRLSSFLNKKIKLVPRFGISETAKDFSTYIKQSSGWFFSSCLFINDYLHAQIIQKTKVLKIRDFIFILYGFFKAFRWLNKGLFHLIGIVLSIYYKSIPLTILFFSSLMLNSTIPV